MPLAATVAKKTLSLPPDVLALAKEQGVDAYLPAMIEVLHEVFGEDRAFAVEVEEDPEVADLRNILFTVEGTWTPEEGRALQLMWYDKTSAICPAPLICTFRLFINRRNP